MLYLYLYSSFTFLTFLFVRLLFKYLKSVFSQIAGTFPLSPITIWLLLSYLCIQMYILFLPQSLYWLVFIPHLVLCLPSFHFYFQGSIPHNQSSITWFITFRGDTAGRYYCIQFHLRHIYFQTFCSGIVLNGACRSKFHFACRLMGNNIYLFTSSTPKWIPRFITSMCSVKCCNFPYCGSAQ